MRKMFALALLVGLLLQPAPLRAQSDDDQLPADLIFTTGENTLSYKTLVYVDAETLEITPFYTDEQATYIRPLSWSPDGNLLAIMRSIVGNDRPFYTNEVCLLNRGGILQRCFEERPSIAVQIGDDFIVTWSDDSQKAYFVSFEKTGKYFGSYRLIEADVATGSTLRVLFEYPKSQQEYTSKFAWSPDFNFVAIGVEANIIERNTGNVPTVLLDRKAGSQLDLTSIAPEHTLFVHYVCSRMSPQGTYLTVEARYNPSEYAPTSPSIPSDNMGLSIVYNYQTGEQFLLGEPNGDGTFQVSGCPVWQPDEKAFFFRAYDLQGETRFIYKYSIEQQSLAIIHQFAPDEWNLPPIDYLVLSPGGTHFAFHTHRIFEVGVIDPTGEVQVFSTPGEADFFPIWVPPALPE